MSKKRRVVIALGGNALGNTLPEQMAAVEKAAINFGKTGTVFHA